MVPGVPLEQPMSCRNCAYIHIYVLHYCNNIFDVLRMVS